MNSIRLFFFAATLCTLLMLGCATENVTVYRSNNLPPAQCAILHNPPGSVEVYEIDDEPFNKDGFIEKLLDPTFYVYDRIHLTPGVHKLRGGYYQKGYKSETRAEFENDFLFEAGKHYQMDYRIKGGKIWFRLIEVKS